MLPAGRGCLRAGMCSRVPWVAIGAVAAGREAAESILRYLDGKEMAEGREETVVEQPVYRPVPKETPKVLRAPMPELPVPERENNFNEVELGYSEESASAEADRCLNCGYCCECRQCETACLADAIDHGMTPETETIHVGSVILAPGFEPFDPKPYAPYAADHPNVVTSLEFERLLSASGPV